MRIARVAALTAFVAASSAWGATAPQPEPGRYLAKIVVTEAHPAECPYPLGADYSGVLHYGGLQASQMTIRIPMVIDGSSLIDRQVLTITSGAGSVRPSGTLSVHMTPLDLTVTGSFEAELTPSDSEAFMAKITEMVPAIVPGRGGAVDPRGDCTEVLQIALTRTD
jgi:hypothetical protein